MLQVFGDLWATPADVHVITTNGVVKRDGTCVMGRGCALEAKTMFPGIDLKLGGLIAQYGNRPFNLGVWQHDGSFYRVASLPTKHRWDRPGDLALIRESLWHLVAMTNKFHWGHVVLPRPGVG